LRAVDARTTYRIRPDGPEDVAFMRDMLYEAFYWRPEDPKPPKEEIFSLPELAHYLEGWGRPGNASVVALNPRDGEKIGAAWYRLMTPGDPAYGFVDTATPEVSIAVSPEYRGAGVGEALLRALVQTAHVEGFEALTLASRREMRRSRSTSVPVSGSFVFRRASGP